MIYGKFRNKDIKCQKCHKYFKTFEEKQTDVNIAINLLKLAYEDEFDTAAIISGDSDLIPSVKAIKTTFPSKSIRLIIPINRSAEELKNCCDKYMKIKEKHLQTSLFPYEIDMNGKKLICPMKWR